MTYNQAVTELLCTPGLGFSISVDPNMEKQRDAAKEFINKFMNQTGFRMSGYLQGLLNKHTIPFIFYNSDDKYLYGSNMINFDSVNILDIMLNKTDENDFMELLG